MIDREILSGGFRSFFHIEINSTTNEYDFARKKREMRLDIDRQDGVGRVERGRGGNKKVKYAQGNRRIPTENFVRAAR